MNKKKRKIKKTKKMLTAKTVKTLKNGTAFKNADEYRSLPGAKLTLVLTADWHTDGDNYRDRNNILRQCLAGVCHAKKPCDALIAAGDITNSAHIFEYNNLRRYIKTFCPNLRIIPQMGNHDSRGTSIYPYFDEAQALFQEFCAFCGIKTEKNYYKTGVNGYTVILLGTEKLLEDNAYFSSEQLSFFSDELCKASKLNRPVFVINHQPLKGSAAAANNPKADTGEQSDKIKEIMIKYSSEKSPVIYVSGHIHSFGGEWLQKIGNIYCISLPSFLYNDGGGWGYIADVTENELSLRCRNFITGTNKPEYSCSIKL